MNFKSKKVIDRKNLNSRGSNSSTEEEIPPRIDSDEEYEFNPKPQIVTPDRKKILNYWTKLDFDVESKRKSFFKPPSISLPKNWSQKNPKTLDFFSLILDDTFLEKVVTRTNDYVQEKACSKEKDLKVQKTSKVPGKIYQWMSFEFFWDYFFGWGWFGFQI